MGTFLKNREIQSGSTGIRIPTGTAANRPDQPVFGQIRFNTDSSLVEFYNGTAWVSLSAGGSVSYTVDDFTGDGSTEVFVMSEAESDETQIIVFVGSIYQDPATAYTVDGGFNITFTSTPPIDIPINVIHTNS